VNNLLPLSFFIFSLLAGNGDVEDPLSQSEESEVETELIVAELEFSVSAD